ncbi:protein MGARP isoform X2 [Erpetoichthys calabaricus]|uniref:protein MGARP isoform X2 n=1 Tax=Erpetoichthys calabaricus TaxID=27687 RepID=UPI0010A07BE3|nr:protein MGARP isoform X2 [Erpetoichthys calabaricus]
MHLWWTAWQRVAPLVRRPVFTRNVLSLRHMSSSQVPGSSGDNMMYILLTGGCCLGAGFYAYRTVTRDQARFNDRIEELNRRPKQQWTPKPWPPKAVEQEESGEQVAEEPLVEPQLESHVQEIAEALEEAAAEVTAEVSIIPEKEADSAPAEEEVELPSTEQLSPVMEQPEEASAEEVTTVQEPTIEAIPFPEITEDTSVNSEAVLKEEEPLATSEDPVVSPPLDNCNMSVGQYLAEDATQERKASVAVQPIEIKTLEEEEVIITDREFVPNAQPADEETILQDVTDAAAQVSSTADEVMLKEEESAENSTEILEETAQEFEESTGVAENSVSEIQEEESVKKQESPTDGHAEVAQEHQAAETDTEEKKVAYEEESITQAVAEDVALGERA